MKYGYARVSTKDQSLDMQVDALKDAGCEQIYEEIAKGICSFTSSFLCNSSD